MDPVADDKTNPEYTPKRKRVDQEKKESPPDKHRSGKNDYSYRGGKACRLLPIDNEEIEQAATSDSGADTSLLIETMQKEIDDCARKEELNSSKWIVPIESAYFGTDSQDVQVTGDVCNIDILKYVAAVTNFDQVVEVVGETDPGMKTSSDYVVQLPSPDHLEEFVLTPLTTEATLRFSKHNTSRMQDKMEDRAVKMACKKDPEGTSKPTCKNSFDVLSNYELVLRASKMG